VAPEALSRLGTAIREVATQSLAVMRPVAATGRHADARTTAAGVEPCDTALNNPALRFDHEALGLIAALDDLDRQAADGLAGAVLKDRTRIGTIAEQLPQERKLTEQGGHQQHTTVTILHVGRSHQHMQHQTQRIDQDVALLALDQLALD
jgi:hypothetical protein